MINSNVKIDGIIVYKSNSFPQETSSMNSVRSNSPSLKFLRFTPKGWTIYWDKKS